MKLFDQYIDVLLTNTGITVLLALDSLCAAAYRCTPGSQSRLQGHYPCSYKLGRFILLVLLKGVCLPTVPLLITISQSW